MAENPSHLCLLLAGSKKPSPLFWLDPKQLQSLKGAFLIFGASANKFSCTS
jgi:hypothetical protein